MWDCGVACVAMILDYFDYEEEYASLKKELVLHDGAGTYMPQLGISFLKRGFKTEIITLNQYIFTKKDMLKSQEELLVLINSLLANPKKERFRVPLNYYKEYLELGGKIVVKIPDKGDVLNSLAEKSPLIVGLTNNFLVLDEPVFNLHYNVINGVDDSHVHVLDPRADEFGGVVRYSFDDFFYAVHSSVYADIDNGSLMVVKK